MDDAVAAATFEADQEAFAHFAVQEWAEAAGCCRLRATWRSAAPGR